MKYSEAEATASREMAVQRLLMSSAAYRAAYDARVRALSGVYSNGSSPIEPKTLPQGSGSGLLALPQIATTLSEGK